MLLLIGSGSKIRHEILLGDMARRTPVILLQSAALSWQEPYVHAARQVDLSNVPLLLETVGSVIQEYPVEAVATYEEGLVSLVGEITARTGLPGLSQEAAAVVRDKRAQRIRMRESGLALPVASKLALDAEAGEAFASELGYPVVVKPRHLSGSLGIRIAASPSEFREMYHSCRATDSRGLGTSDGVLVEEFLDGPQFSIDCWVVDGEAGRLCTARILKVWAPHIIDTGYIVGPGIANPEAITAMENAACAAAMAIGVNRTIANVDVIWTRIGPRILEVNGRPGGLLPYLALHSSGLRLGQTFADVVLGHRPAEAAPLRRAAGFAFIYPPKPLRFGGLHIGPDCAGHDWLVKVQETASRGDHVLPPESDPWGHCGWCLVTGETATRVEERIVLLWKTTKVGEYGELE